MRHCRYPRLGKHSTFLQAPAPQGFRGALIALAFKLKRQVVPDKLERRVTLVSRRHAHILESGRGKMKPDDAEIARLRRELARTKAERDILKKAIASFARDQR